MKILFWISLGFIFYTYVGYPLILALRSRFKVLPIVRGEITPFVSIVIAACNEEFNIAKRIENLLMQDYPPSLCEIVVVSDGSSDGTNNIVASFSNRSVHLVQLEERLGKALALNYGVDRALGEIVVFADARQTFASDAVRQLVSNFADPSVGCVSGELMFLEDAIGGTRTEMGAYWRYEKAIRKLESTTGSVVGATGAIYAIRRRLYCPLPMGTILDDVLTPMNVAQQGYRVVFDSAAKAFDVVSKNIDQEWTRKVRTLAGNWQLLSLAPSLFIPWRCLLLWRFSSHKFFRLLVPFVLPLVLLASMMASGAVYQVTLFAQVTLYLIAVTGLVIPRLRTLRLVNVSMFFLVLNAAVVVGFWRWASGKCSTSWLPAYKDEGNLSMNYSGKR